MKLHSVTIDKIDLELLKDQKAELVDLMLGEARTILEDLGKLDALEGVINLLDVIQDACEIKTNHKTKKEVLEMLGSLKLSCEEALDGTWDPSGEGLESFNPMIDDLEEVIRFVNNQKD